VTHRLDRRAENGPDTVGRFGAKALPASEARQEAIAVSTRGMPRSLFGSIGLMTLVTEFIAHDSKLRFGSWNHIYADGNNTLLAAVGGNAD